MAYSKSASTRAAAIRSTARLLRVQGYAATGLSDIVSESGVPKGSLYHHFPAGKSEIATAALDASAARLRSHLEALVAAHPGEPVAAVEDFCNRYIEQLEASRFVLGCPVATVSLEYVEGSVQQACGRAFDVILSVLEAAFEVLGLSKESAAAGALFAVSAIEGALVLSKAQASTEPLARVRDTLAQYLRSLIANETAP
ncbi:MAG: TetR/AcrR family transcriptional regulator [Myxococcota bacterium]